MIILTRYLVLIGLFVFVSCANTNNTIYREVFTSIKNIVTGGNDQIIDSTFFESQRFSFIKVRVGRSDSIIMILLDYKDDVFHWYSADGISIYTKQGKIIETSGLENDIRIVDSADYFVCSNHNDVYLVDFYYPKLKDLKIKTQSSFINDVEYVYMNTSKQVKICNENIKSNLIRYSRDNKFYYDGKTVLKAEQYIHPHFPKITIEFFVK